jgi:solute:Na+ symporter, SSS family
MTAVIITLVLIYISLTLLLGRKARRAAANTSEDYFVAERSLSWGHLALTFFATWFSTFAFLGSPGFFYKHGATWYFTQGVFCLSAPFLAWFMGRKIWLLGRRHGYLTPGDLLADFYQSNAVRYITAIISILALIPYCLIQLVGIGKVFAASTGNAAPYWSGVGLAVLATAFYTFVGGIRAIVWTDIIQGILFFIVLLLGGGITLYAAGGIFDGYTAALAVRPEAFELDPNQVGSPLTMILIWSFGFILLPHLWQRTYMAGSAAAYSKSIVVFSIISFLFIITSMLIGTLAIGFMPELSDSDKLVPLIFAEYLPGALPLLVLATFAAGMSTIDSQLLTAASVIVRDFRAPFVKGKLDSYKEMRLGKIVVLGMILLLGCLAVRPESRGSIILLASKGTAIAFLLLVPLCGPLLWKRASRIGALACLIAGSVTLILFEAEFISTELPLGFGSPLACLLVQAPAFVFFSWVFPSDIEHRITAKFTVQVQTKVDSKNQGRKAA